MITLNSFRLTMTDVCKRFGATAALRGVTLQVRHAEVHALIGENGAGKSTLMKILSGALAPDSGRIELDGQLFRPTDPLHARRSGIAMIYQELNLAPELTVAENILLGEEPARLGWINRPRQRALARQALARLDHEHIELELPVRRLTLAEQQIVEIARALLGQPRVLIMDEPTSSLTRMDTENLFRTIEALRQQGVSVVYISHFLEECQRVASRFTVLRDGESVGTGPMQETRLGTIIHLMVGREIRDIYPRIPHAIGPPLLTVQDLAGIAKPQAVSFTLCRGEILGVAGLVGAGRSETVRACFGLDRVREGVVEVAGWPGRRAGPPERLAQGVGLLSENRKEEGLMLGQSLADNLTLTRFRPLSFLGFVNQGRQRATARRWIERLEVKAHDPLQPIAELSGGNQQKIALGRLLYHEARILLLDEPTRGIDVASKAHIYRLMGELAAQGKAILFVSSYLPELLGVCDRIAVMCRGVLSDIRPAQEWSEQSLITAALGQAENAGAAPPCPR